MPSHESQPAIPGLDGPEWDSPQPELPIDQLTDKQLLDTLDALHTEINEAEQTGSEQNDIANLLYSQLNDMAVERGLIENERTASRLKLIEEDIATVRENLNNPKGLTDASRRELELSLEEMQIELYELQNIQT